MAGLDASQAISRSTQFKTVKQYLSYNSGSATDAVRTFVKPTEDALQSSSDSSDAETALNSSWQSIITTAAYTDYTSPASRKLADFVLELQARGPIERDGQDAQVQDMKLWSDLPLFGWQMREAWNSVANDDSDLETQLKWLNLNAWTARLVSSAHNSSTAPDEPDFTLYAIWTIRTALEDSESTISETALSAAALWFINAAPALWDFSRAEKSFQGKLAAPGQGFEGEGWSGFSRERWRVWATRLSEMQGSVKGERAVGLVEQARKAMGEIVEK